MLLQPSRADIDGDGQVTEVETETFELLLPVLEPEDPVLAELILVYTESDGEAQGTPVDLSGVFAPYRVTQGSSGGTLQESCDCKAFIRGDANNGNLIDIGDAQYILNYVNSSGPPPDPLDSGDANDDGGIDISDAMYLLDYLGGGGYPKPPLPFGDYNRTHLFEGLDPTIDNLDNPCDLRVQNFAEFDPSVAHVDMMGEDGKEDAVWVTPGGVVWFEQAGSYNSQVFQQDFQAYGETIYSVAVSREGVVYGITDSPAGKVFAMVDSDPDGHADEIYDFDVGHEILDAVLVDLSGPGTDTTEQGMITLHKVDGHEAFTILRDSDGDGIIDGNESTFLDCSQDWMLSNPKGLAVDGRTARVFVSGTDEVEGEVVPAVAFYQDNLCAGQQPGGDKVIDEGSGVRYYNDDPDAQKPDYKFPGLYYLPYQRTLFVLALSYEYDASIVCVKDEKDNVYDYTEVCRSLYYAYDPGADTPEPKYIYVFAFEKEGHNYIEASVTMDDGWTVWEYLTQLGENCCLGERDAVFSVPNAALAAMKFAVCYAYVIQMGGDWVSGIQVDSYQNFFSYATLDENDGHNRHFTAWYKGKKWGTCGGKAPTSFSWPEDEVDDDTGLAVYRWFNAPNPNQKPSEMWVVTDTGWGLDVEPCDNNPGPDYPLWPGWITDWYFDGTIKLDNNGNPFDIFENFISACGDLNLAKVRYREWYSPGYGVDFQQYECDVVGEDWHGDYYSTGYNDQQPKAFVPSVGPGVPFKVNVKLKVDADRRQGVPTGAGKDEWGGLKLHNGADAGNQAMWLYFRIRCK